MRDAGGRDGLLWIAGDERQEANRNERYCKKYEIGRAGRGGTMITETKI